MTRDETKNDRQRDEQETLDANRQGDEVEASTGETDDQGSQDARRHEGV